MELFYYRDPHRNFGDDLNAVLWPHILSARMYEADDLVVVGIGSILNEEWLERFTGGGERIVVLGTGTSYGAPPADVVNWSVLAVRGPLTAAMIGMPDRAVTDGAILLADAPALIGPPRERTDILFMPHHRSVRAAPWEAIAQAAGMRYVSPQQPVDAVLAAFARAKLVVTEAMHGAIVADTLRIPWLPIVIAPTIDEFKWRDWCGSMNLPFRPAYVAAGDAHDARRHARMRRILADAGIAGHAALSEQAGAGELADYLARRFSPATKAALLNPIRRSLANRAVSRMLRLSDHRHRARAVRSLMAAATATPFLSDETLFRARLAQMRDAVAAAESIARRRDERRSVAL